MATHSSVLAWRIPGMVEPGVHLVEPGAAVYGVAQSRTKLKQLSSSMDIKLRSETAKSE